MRALVRVRWPWTGSERRWRVAAIALDVHQALDVHRDVLAEIAFDVALVLNDLTDAVDLVFAQILDLLEGSTFAFSRILSDAGLPIPKMYVSAIRACLLRGRSTPAIRAMCFLWCFGCVPPASTGSHGLFG